MAIQFARVEYVSRSVGKNACQKAAYNKRDFIKCERNGVVYYYQHKGGNLHHEVMLPQGTDQKFRDAKTLWNEVEWFEKRKDSQLAKEMVVALPDNKELTKVDRIAIARQIATECFVSKGVAVQLDVHSPDKDEKNWHAHLLITTRRFTVDGKSFQSHKARDLDPEIRKGRVTEGDHYGEICARIQNEYFEKQGLNIRVDPIGIVPQEHLGPVRMRNHMNDALVRSELLRQANESLSEDPEAILEELTRTKSVFSKKDVEAFCSKHVSLEKRSSVVEAVLNHKQILLLYAKDTLEGAKLFTTQTIREEEGKLLRFAESLHKKSSFRISQRVVDAVINSSTLSVEQQKVVRHSLQNEGNLKIIVGRAGTGKSYTLQHVREIYQKSGYRVLGAAFTNKVSRDLEDKGFEAKTLHKLLFDLKNKRDALTSKTVLMIDEAGMINNALFIEVFNQAKLKGAKVILVGDSRQFSSVNRGGMFSALCRTYGYSVLKEVRRQEHAWQREFSELFSDFKTYEAAKLLDKHGYLEFKSSKEACMAAIVNDWVKESFTKNSPPPFILAARNVDVDALNLSIREVRKKRGEIGISDYSIETLRGREPYAIGDRIQLTVTDQKQNLFNGDFGTLSKVEKEKWHLTLDSGKRVDFNPELYKGLRHGYAGTHYKSQSASIPKVLVLHNPLSGFQGSYVAQTRFIQSMKVYIPQDRCRNLEEFSKQILRASPALSSQGFYTQEDVRVLQAGQRRDTLRSVFSSSWVKVKDAFHSNKEFYEFTNQRNTQTAKVLKMDPPFALEGQSSHTLTSSLQSLLINQFKEKQGYTPGYEDLTQIENKSKNVLQELFNFKETQNRELKYSEVLSILNAASDKERVEKESVSSSQEKPLSEDQKISNPAPGQINNGIPLSSESSFSSFSNVKERYYSRQDFERLENALKDRIEDLVLELLGPKTKASTANQWRFGDKDGSLFVTINGTKRGLYHDFATGEGGGPLQLISALKGTQGRQTWKWAEDWLGGSIVLDKGNKANLLHQTKSSSSLKHEESSFKIKGVQELYQQKQSLKDTQAERYLKQERKLGEASQNTDESNLAFIPRGKSFHYNNKSITLSYDTVASFARNPQGKVSAVQLISLRNGKKADTKINKRSYGVLAGSFVQIQKGQKTLFIAEGVETALSIKETGVRGQIEASLGISNLKNREVTGFERVVICADNDAHKPSSKTGDIIQKAKETYEAQGVTVTIVRPEKAGYDFNDVLKKEGIERVKEYFKDHLIEVKENSLLLEKDKTSFKDKKGYNNAYEKDTYGQSSKELNCTQSSESAEGNSLQKTKLKTEGVSSTQELDLQVKTQTTTESVIKSSDAKDSSKTETPVLSIKERLRQAREKILKSSSREGKDRDIEW